MLGLPLQGEGRTHSQDQEKRGGEVNERLVRAYSRLLWQVVIVLAIVGCLWQRDWTNALILSLFSEVLNVRYQLQDMVRK